jgi:hypothetical protein
VGWELPERYASTRACQLLRVAVMFHMDPREVDKMDEQCDPLLDLLLNAEVLFRAERVRELELMAAVSAGGVA